MAVAIRLTRVGATKRPSYRVVAIDKRRARDGRALEILGYYDPLTEPATVQLNSDRIRDWIGKGAQPSDTVVRLMRQAEAAAAGPVADKPRRATGSSRPSKKAQAKAAAAAAQPDEPAVQEPETEAAPEAVATEAATAVEPSVDEAGADASAEESVDAEKADAEKADAEKADA